MVSSVVKIFEDADEQNARAPHDVKVLIPIIVDELNLRVQNKTLHCEISLPVLLRDMNSDPDTAISIALYDLEKVYVAFKAFTGREYAQYRNDLLVAQHPDGISAQARGMLLPPSSPKMPRAVTTKPTLRLVKTADEKKPSPEITDEQKLFRIKSRLPLKPDDGFAELAKDFGFSNEDELSEFFMEKTGLRITVYNMFAVKGRPSRTPADISNDFQASDFEM